MYQVIHQGGILGYIPGFNPRKRDNEAHSLSSSLGEERDNEAHSLPDSMRKEGQNVAESWEKSRK